MPVSSLVLPVSEVLAVFILTPDWVVPVLFWLEVCVLPKHILVCLLVGNRAGLAAPGVDDARAAPAPALFQVEEKGEARVAGERVGVGGERRAHARHAGQREEPAVGEEFSVAVPPVGTDHA